MLEYLGQLDRVNGFPSLGWLCPALNGENIAPTSASYHSHSARVSSSISLRRYALQVQLGCSQLFPLQEKAQQNWAVSLGLGQAD